MPCVTDDRPVLRRVNRRRHLNDTPVDHHKKSGQKSESIFCSLFSFEKTEMTKTSGFLVLSPGTDKTD